MSLGVALQNALSGLKISQQSFTVLSQNIANANNEDYARQTITQASQNIGSETGNGVLIKEIKRVADEFIEGAVVGRTSEVKRASTVKDYYDQVQLYIGQPGNGNSIDSYVNNFFNKMTELSTNPELSSAKNSTVNTGRILAQELSTLAKSMEELRFDADKQIDVSVDNINQELRKIHGLNLSIISAKKNGEGINGIKDEMIASLKRISEEIDIKYRITDNGQIYISTKDGVALLEDNLFELDYKPATSADAFIGDIASNPIKVYSLNAAGDRVGGSVTLVSGGDREEVTTNLLAGRLKGLLDVRDKLIPDILDQLDNMAAVLRDEINAIHNNGSAFPPLNSMTGTRLIDPTEANLWSGSVMIASLKEDGTVSTSPYATDIGDEIGRAPLILNLGKLNDGSGDGKPTFQTIIDEINRYYGTPKDRTVLQDSLGTTLLSDIKLGIKSDSLTGGAGTLSFDLDLSNLTANNATVQITGASVGTGNATVAAPASFPQSFDISAGTQVRTGADLGFDLTITGAGTVTVTLNVLVTDGNGLTSTSTITYNIPEKTTDYLNDRIVAASVTGEAAIETPTTTARFLTAKLVDENGVEVSKNVSTGDYTDSGYLVIEGNSSSYRVAISELNSTHKGSPTEGVPATNFGFSHYFGLNNFFDSNDGVKADAAYNMAVSKDITNNPNHIATGRLSLSPEQTIDGAMPRYTYQVANGSNQAAVELAELGLNNASFAAAGGLPQISTTLGGYAAEILGFIASETANATQDFKQEDLIFQGFVERDRNIRGVNIDEEMANTIIFQNAYSANARVISTANELFKTLIDTF